MKKSIMKAGALVACGALVAALGLFGCASGSGSSASASASSAAAESAAEYTLIKDGALTVITSPDYPPFENLDEASGDYVGFEIDLMKAIGEEMGLEVVFEPMQFDTIMPAIVSGGKADVGVSGFSVTPERKKEIDFTNAFYTDDMAVAVMKDGAITDANVDEELAKAEAVIAVQTGTTGADFAKENYPEATIQGYGNSTDCFAAMQAGQASAVITNKSVVADMLANGYESAHIVKAVATGEDYAFIVSKESPKLTEALNAAIDKLAADGTLDQIKAKWNLA